MLHQNALGLEVFQDEEWHMAPKPDEKHYPRFSIVQFNAVDLDVETGPLQELLARGMVPAFGPIAQRALIDTKNAAAEANCESVSNEQTPPMPGASTALELGGK